MQGGEKSGAKAWEKVKITVAKNSGFCFGVKAAVKIAESYAPRGAYCLGEIIHNETVVEKLSRLGLKTVTSLNGVECGTVIVRSHGVGKAVYDDISNKGLTLVDATCPFVKKIHTLVKKFYQEGFHVVIIGKRAHPEVAGINGWCENSASVVENAQELEEIKSTLLNKEKLCFVAQTTFSKKKYDDIVKKILKCQFKTVEIFDTICYTTNERQSEAIALASTNDKVLVIGSRNSSNTTKLYETCKSIRYETYHIETVADLKNIEFKPLDKIAIVAGASTPEELIMEVKEYMSDNFEDVSKEFKDYLDESFVQYKDGLRIKGTVIHANADGIKVNIGGKKDGFIKKDEVNIDGEYNAADYPEGSPIEAIITNKNDAESGCVLLSKKKVDKIIEGDKFVENIRGGEIFELGGTRVIKGGLLGHMGTYSVFIPASQLKERGNYVKDLKAYEGKKLRLTAIEIDDEKHEIVASQRKVLEEERKEKEDIFWENVQPNVVVNGVVKRATNFGAFVSVDGIDCLAHIVDLSWTHIKSVEDVLQIGQSYDFLVLSADREKGRVSLGYKQLQPHPFTTALEKHPVGSIVKGKVVSILPFGAFVEIEPGIEGLVHVSEAAHSFVKNINEVLKVGDEVDVKILNIDEPNRKITLSIKACQDAPAETASDRPARSESGDNRNDKRAPRKSRAEKSGDDNNEWSEDTSNNPFADLLKDLDVK